MKLTKRNLEWLKQGATPLQIEALDYALDEWENYENKKKIFDDVLDYGCISGMVDSLIYYSQTIPFFEKHKDEINGLLAELLDEIGEASPAKLFKNWDYMDPLATGANNQNLLAWFGFEETLRRVSWQFDGEEF